MRELIIDKLIILGVDPSILLKYDEPHRFYHNLNHIEEMILTSLNENTLDDELFLAIVFHDIIYDPKAKDNEEKSVEFFTHYCENEKIKQAILDTKTHKPTNELSEKLCKLDLNVLYSDYKTFIDYEDKIFKEYQYMNSKIYREKRIKFLERYNVKDEFINYVKNKYK